MMGGRSSNSTTHSRPKEKTLRIGPPEFRWSCARELLGERRRSVDLWRRYFLDDRRQRHSCVDDLLDTTSTINTAVLTVGNSGPVSATTNLLLAYSLTLAGMTHTVTQTATWTITPSLDTFVAVQASAPVLFETAAGDWYVTLNGFSFSANTLGTQTQGVTADFAPVPVPEPASLLLFGTGAVGALARRRRRRHA
jgi:PEP-CTERM motif